jgi:calcium-dependent protein kinase
MGCVPTNSRPIISRKQNTEEVEKIPTPEKISFEFSSRINHRPKTSKLSENIKIKNLITKVETHVEENYKFLNKLGKGSFGSVFKVIHINTGLVRAIKVIKKENLQYQDDDQKFLKEIEILINCEHPNIIKIFEYYSDNYNYYLVTEYISGGELYETIITWKLFDEEKAYYIMSQVLSAVNYLHSKGIVHRDVKPENMLVENKVKNNNKEMLNIKLIDFGTSNYYNESKKFTLKVGSPYYIAPEVIKKSYDYKCDIWSCGVILFILLVGYPPFKGNTQKDLLNSIVKGKYSISGPEWSRVSPEAKDLVTKMLEVDTTKRLSAEECFKHPWMTKFHDKSKIDNNYFVSVLTNIRNFNASEKLQQATLAYIVHFLYSSMELEGLKNVFKQLDKNKDGRLTYDELRNGFETVFGRYLTEIEMRQIIEDVDGDNDGFISYEEFLRVSINQKKLLDEKNLKMAFEKFDLNGDGKLSKDEIRNVLGTSDNEYINLLLSQVNQNNDGFLSYPEFCDLMNSVIDVAVSVNFYNFRNKIKQISFRVICLY